MAISESRTLFSKLASVYSNNNVTGSVSASECEFTVSTIGARCVNVDGPFRLSDCALSATGAATIAISSFASRGIITGNNIDGDINTSGGTNHVLTTNLISSGSTLTLSASDEDAHNIIY